MPQIWKYQNLNLTENVKKYVKRANFRKFRSISLN